MIEGSRPYNWTQNSEEGTKAVQTIGDVCDTWASSIYDLQVGEEWNVNARPFGKKLHAIIST